MRACIVGLLGMMLAATVLAQTDSNDGKAKMLDTLFTKLQTATDPSAIQTLEQAIWEQWTMVPSGPPRQLMARGIAEMQQQEMEGALATFTKLIEIAPELSEAWNKRATVQWLLGNFPASISDICETIKREPRHFGAYSGLGMMRRDMNEPARARAAFELAKKWNPHIVGLDEEIERMKALGGDVPADPLGCGEHVSSR
jgi:tetratricopeptide (TPR) repeat protein